MVNPLPKDDLAADLRGIVKAAVVADAEGNYYTDHDILLQQLAIYVVARDHKVFDHAHKLGREQWAKMVAGKYRDLPLQQASTPAFVMRWLDSYADFTIPKRPKLNNDKIGAKP